MRVAMIDTANQTPHYVYPLCWALSAAGCAVELITAPFIYDYGQLPPSGFPVHELFARTSALRPLRRFQALRRAVRALQYPLDWAAVLHHLRESRPDVVHVQWAMLPPVDALAFRAIRRLGIRLIYTVHDIRFRHAAWQQPWRSARPLYGLADALIVHTEANRRDLCLASGLPSSRVHVVASGSEQGWARPMVPRDVARSSLGLPSEAPLILFFGNIKPYKQLSLLLEALPRVLERSRTARLLIVGYPVEPFDRYRRIVAQLDLSASVHERLGFVSEDEKARYFGAADVVVLPYGEADFSGVLLTAYLFGRPVVVTDTGGMRELVEEGETGYVVPPSDREALAEAILRVLLDPVRRARMGERGRELALTKYAWPASARATLEVYRDGGARTP